MNDSAAQEKMERALVIAKKAWNGAEMPPIFEGQAKDTGKISIAILAVKIVDMIDMGA